VSASLLSRFIPGERALGTHYTGMCVLSRVGLDAVEKRQITSPARNRTPAAHLVARHCVDSEIPIPQLLYIRRIIRGVVCLETVLNRLIQSVNNLA
jgi:hypothetical protein